eukprot:676953-Amphidinium_carterae.1
MTPRTPRASVPPTREEVQRVRSAVTPRTSRASVPHTPREVMQRDRRNRMSSHATPAVEIPNTPVHQSVGQSSLGVQTRVMHPTVREGLQLRLASPLHCAWFYITITEQDICQPLHLVTPEVIERYIKEAYPAHVLPAHRIGLSVEGLALRHAYHLPDFALQAGLLDAHPSALLGGDRDPQQFAILMKK